MICKGITLFLFKKSNFVVKDYKFQISWLDDTTKIFVVFTSIIYTQSCKMIRLFEYLSLNISNVNSVHMSYLFSYCYLYLLCSFSIIFNIIFIKLKFCGQKGREAFLAYLFPRQIPSCGGFPYFCTIKFCTYLLKYISIYLNLCLGHGLKTF